MILVEINHPFPPVQDAQQQDAGWKYRIPSFLLTIWGTHGKWSWHNIYIYIYIYIHIYIYIYIHVDSCGDIFSYYLEILWFFSKKEAFRKVFDLRLPGPHRLSHTWRRGLAEDGGRVLYRPEQFHPDAHLIWLAWLLHQAWSFRRLNSSV